MGVRLAQHPIGRLLAEHLGNPLITSSLPIEDEDEPELLHQSRAHRRALRECRLHHPRCWRHPAGSLDDVDCTEEPFEVLRYGHGRLADEEPLLKKD